MCHSELAHPPVYHQSITKQRDGSSRIIATIEIAIGRNERGTIGILMNRLEVEMTYVRS